MERLASSAVALACSARSSRGGQFVFDRLLLGNVGVRAEPLHDAALRSPSAACHGSRTAGTRHQPPATGKSCRTVHRSGCNPATARAPSEASADRGHFAIPSPPFARAWCRCTRTSGGCTSRSSRQPWRPRQVAESRPPACGTAVHSLAGLRPPVCAVTSIQTPMYSRTVPSAFRTGTPRPDVPPRSVMDAEEIFDFVDPPGIERLLPRRGHAVAVLGANGIHPAESVRLLGVLAGVSLPGRDRHVHFAARIGGPHDLCRRLDERTEPLFALLQGPFHPFGAVMSRVIPTRPTIFPWPSAIGTFVVSISIRPPLTSRWGSSLSTNGCPDHNNSSSSAR